MFFECWSPSEVELQVFAVFLKVGWSPVGPCDGWFHKDRLQRPNRKKIRTIKKTAKHCAKIGPLQASNNFKPFHRVRHNSTRKWQIQV